MAPLIRIATATVGEARHGRFVWLVLALALAGLAVTGFASKMAITESRAIQAVLLGNLLRWGVVFLACLFVVGSFIREMNDKVLELMLSLPLPRHQYLLGKFLGFAAVLSLAALGLGLPLLLFSPWQQVMLWTVSLMVELWIVAALGLLCALTFSQVTAAAGAVAAIYLLARAMDALHLMGHDPQSAASLAHRFMTTFLDFIAIFLPPLDRFTRSEWLAHGTGTWGDLATIMIQGLLFLLLVLVAAMFDLRRKNF